MGAARTQNGGAAGGDGTGDGTSRHGTSGGGEDAPVAEARASERLDLAAVAWMVFLTFIWGVNAVSIKVLTLGMAPIMSAALRGMIALGILTVYCAARGESFRFGRPLLLHSALAAIIFASEAVLLYQGARFTNGGHIAIFINMAPFFVAGGAHYLLPGERLNLFKIGGLVLAFGGVVVLFSDDLGGQGAGLWRGDLLVIGAAAMWASSTLYVKGVLAHRLSAARLMWVRMVVSSPLLLGASLIFEPEPFFAVTGTTLLALFFQGTVVVSFSYMIWVRMLQRYPAGRLQPFTFLTPVWGVLTGVVLLNEAVSLVMAVGIALVGGGLWLVNQERRAVKPAIMPRRPAADATETPAPGKAT